ncbi:MAG: hypothetical protein WDW36_004412 [Sanguina aurantia]
MTSEALPDSGPPENGIQVAVRVRPLNSRERDGGHRTCVSFDEPSKQVVLTAVDRSTLLQLRGTAAKGYAFDKRFGQDDNSDNIYEGCIKQLVESCFKGYNATVLAYGQTGSGKTHTMSGGTGIHGLPEEGITPQVIRHIFAIVEGLKKRQQPGEKTTVSASGLELYNEELRDLATGGPRTDVGTGWDAGKAPTGGLKLQERPVGKDGRVVPEVVGVYEREVKTKEELQKFYDECLQNRSTTSTKMNDSSSRSHAIFTITITRTVVEVLNELSVEFKAKVRTSDYAAKLHMVDLAGSERVKRSGVTGQALKEATHINSGLLALGNVIVALANEGEGKKKGHVPYRDSKLTRLLQDSLGGNSLTTLISCISPSEQDFEETNNTLKYANRACSIKNSPLPNKFTTLEEDLLPMLPSAGGAPGLGMLQLQALLQDHERIKEQRERREKERREKEERRFAELQAITDAAIKKPGFQRLRANQYDELRRQLASGGTNIPSAQMVGDNTLRGFGKLRLTQSVDGPLLPPGGRNSGNRSNPLRASSGRTPPPPGGPDPDASPRATPGQRTPGSRVRAKPVSAGSTGFASWLATQDDAESELPAPVKGDDDGDGLGSEDYLEEDEGSVVEQTHRQRSLALSGLAIDAPAVSRRPPPTPATHLQEGEGEDACVAGDAGEGASRVAQAEGTDAAAQKDKFRRKAAAPNSPGGGSDGAQVDEGDDAYLAEDDVIIEDDYEGEDADERRMMQQEQEEEEEEEEEEYDPIDDTTVPVLLARFKVNQHDTLSVFKACTKEDFEDVIGLLPENTPLPASDKMTYLLARLEVHPGRDIPASLELVASGESSMTEAVGPAVGCLMATFGTNMISSCIFNFEDPADLRLYTVEERIELWGLQIPHNSARPPLAADAAAPGGGPDAGDAPCPARAPGAAEVITWSSVDRLNMSIGLLYSLCNHATDNNIRCGFCVPRPQLLKRWMQAGVRMEQVRSGLKLIYPPEAHDYEYYKASTVAWFMVADVKAKLEQVLGIVASAAARPEDASNLFGTK